VDFFLSLLASMHLFSVGGLMCYDGRQVGVTSQSKAWVLEGQWVWGFMAGGALAGLQRFCSGIWSVCHLGGYFVLCMPCYSLCTLVCMHLSTCICLEVTCFCISRLCCWSLVLSSGRSFQIGL
jgi:hypothetical protein